MYFMDIKPSTHNLAKSRWGKKKSEIKQKLPSQYKEIHIFDLNGHVVMNGNVQMFDFAPKKYILFGK